MPIEAEIHSGEVLFSKLIRITDDGENAEGLWTSRGILFISFNRATHSNSQVYIMDPGTGVQTRVSFSDGLSYKPIVVGDYIVYSSSTDEEKENPNLERLTGGSAPSPLEVERAAIQEQKLPPMEIYSRKNSRDTVARLTRRPGLDVAEASDSKGVRILKTTRQGERIAISWLGLKGGERTIINVQTDRLPAMHPSPDGKEMAFTRIGTNSNLEVVITTINGQKTKTLLSRPMKIRDMTWAPDGKYLYFAAEITDSQWDIYRINRDGSCLERITSDPSADLFPSLSPDGRRLLFTSSRTDEFELYIADMQEVANRTCL